MKDEEKIDFSLSIDNICIKRTRFISCKFHINIYNCGNRSKLIHYLCGLRNIDSHKKTAKRVLNNNNTGLTIFELEVL